MGCSPQWHLVGICSSFLFHRRKKCIFLLLRRGFLKSLQLASSHLPLRLKTFQPYLHSIPRWQVNCSVLTVFFIPDPLLPLGLRLGLALYSHSLPLADWADCFFLLEVRNTDSLFFPLQSPVMCVLQKQCCTAILAEKHGDTFGLTSCESKLWESKQMD